MTRGRKRAAVATYRPPKNLLKMFYRGQWPCAKYYKGVMYRGVYISALEISEAYPAVFASRAIRGRCERWVWWEVRVVLDEVLRRRVIGYPDVE